MKKYHLYHHSPQGIHKGFGITTRFWDGVVRYPISGSGTPIPKQELK
jgi:sterol desaturase/sphingolipid hydroxylase (fatty acid hydroxylase superfamily)